MNGDEKKAVANPMQISRANSGSKRYEDAGTRSGLSDIKEDPVLNDTNTLQVDNSSGSGKNVIVDQQPKRRVSIISDPVSEGRNTSGLYNISGYENPAFEQNAMQKISQVRNFHLKLKYKNS